MRSIPVAAALAGLLGCSGGDEGRGPVALPCDIRDAPCQEAIFEATAEIRGQPDARRPPVRTATLEQVASEFRAALAADDAPDDPWFEALGQLGLVAVGTGSDEAGIEAFLENVAAYYDSRQGGVTVIDRGVGDDLDSDDFVLSHEFAHALQDQAQGLDAFRARFADTTDAGVALDTLVEGEATLLAFVFFAEAVAEGSVARVDFEAFGEDVVGSALESMVRSQSPLVVGLQSLSYGIGTPPLAAVWQASGNAGIAALYDAPKTTLADWIDDAAAFGLGAERSLGCYPVTAPPGFQAVDSDRLGFTGALSLLVAGDVEATTAFEQSKAWLDDRVVLFVDAPGATIPRVATAWRVRWADAADAATFAEVASATLTPGWSEVVIDGSDVLIRAADDPALLVEWGPMACGAEGDLPVAASEAPAVSALRGSTPGFWRSGRPRLR